MPDAWTVEQSLFVSKMQDEIDQLRGANEAMLATLKAIAAWPDHDVREPANSMAQVARLTIDKVHPYEGDDYGPGAGDLDDSPEYHAARSGELIDGEVTP